MLPRSFKKKWKRDEKKFVMKKIYPYLHRYASTGKCHINNYPDQSLNQNVNPLIGNSSLIKFVLENVDALRTKRSKAKMRAVIKNQKKMMAHEWTELCAEKMRLHRLQIEIGQRHMAEVDRIEGQREANKVRSNDTYKQRHETWLKLAKGMEMQNRIRPKDLMSNQQNPLPNPIIHNRRELGVDKLLEPVAPSYMDYYKACWRFLADWYDKGEPWIPFMSYYNYTAHPIPSFAPQEVQNAVFYGKDCLGRTWRMEKLIMDHDSPEIECERMKKSMLPDFSVRCDINPIPGKFTRKKFLSKFDKDVKRRAKMKKKKKQDDEEGEGGDEDDDDMLSSKDSSSDASSSGKTKDKK